VSVGTGEIAGCDGNGVAVGCAVGVATLEPWSVPVQPSVRNIAMINSSQIIFLFMLITYPVVPKALMTLPLVLV
jgi:hypothetical protein